MDPHQKKYKNNKNKELHLMKTSFDGIQKGAYDDDRDGVLNLAEESACRNYYFPTSAITKTKWNFVLLLEKIEAPKLQQQPRRGDPGRLVLNQQPVVVPCCPCGSTYLEHETRKLFSNLCRERRRQRRTSRNL
jgi:hypothetical protein